MTTLAYQRLATAAGLNPNMAAATAGGDTIPFNERGFLMVKNGSAASINLTLVVPGNTQFGLANPDPVIAIPAGATMLIGPMTQALGDPTNNLICTVQYSAVASVTVAAVQM